MNAKLMVKTFFVATVALTYAPLSAETRVVDKLHGPYRTIQEAVEAAAEGDTVFIKNGVYDVGGKLDGFTTSMSNRVYVTKSLTLVGESKDGAIIKGDHATEGVDSYGLGCGANAVRCLGINADNVVVSNLTLTGGATHDTTAGYDKEENNGGGVFVANDKTGIVVVDCIISNNVARRGGAVGTSGSGSLENHNKRLMVRTWVHGNKATWGNPAVFGCLAAYSLFTGHFSSSSLTHAATFVNCTFADGNCRNHSGSENVVGYNCLFADTWHKDDTATAKWNNCAFNKSIDDPDQKSATNQFCVLNPGYDLFMAPPLVDYRLHTGATAVIGKGDASFLENIPEAYRNIDFYGHAVDAASVNLGCAQEVVTPTGGTIMFAKQDGMTKAGSLGHYGASLDCGLYSFNGRPLNAPYYLGYIRTMEGRMIVTVTHDPSNATADSKKKGLHSFAASGSDTMRRFAQMDGSFVLMAPPAGKTLTLTPSFNAAVLTVDRASTSETPDGTEDAPYASIQAAIDKVASGAFATIRVKAGIYDNDTGRLANNLTNRIFSNGRKVRLVSVDGRGKAVLPGAPDPSVALNAWPFGCGAGAMRCAFLQGGCAIQGFALTRGYSNTNADDTGRRGGALWLADGSSALDCVITNNVGWQGVAINGTESGYAPTAFALRCYIADNTSITTNKTGALDRTGGIVRSTTVGSSIFYDNHGSNFGSYERQYTFQTTLADGASADNGNLLSGAENVNAVILAKTGNLNSPTLIGGVYQTATGKINAEASSSAVNADPLLADPAYGDFRLGATSPARTCGVMRHDDFTDSTKAAYYMFGATDFNGNVFRLFDGKPVCGAVDLYAPTVVLNGKTTVLGVSSDRTFTYTSVSDDPHPWLGLEVTENGVVTTNATKSFTYTVQDSVDNPYALTIRDLYDSNWYVSDADGDDANAGSSAAPKKTLKGALQYAVEGDTVHVAAGTYATETMTQTKRFGNSGDSKNAAYTHAARAVVPSGVSVIGAGADKTFIVGANDSNAADANKGCGPAAVRCVALAKGARLSGFTLTGGRTDVGTDYINNDDDFHGGGVLAEYSGTESELAVITDCVISNCVARRGGGGFFGVYNRARFLDNSIIQGGNGPAARGDGGVTCRLVNCLIDRNDGWATVYDVTALNCTFGADNAQSGGTKDGMSLLVNAKEVRNCMILGTKTAGGSSLTFVNCVFSPQTEANLKKASDSQPTVDASCIATTDLSVDANLAPVIGENAAVDAVDAAGYDAEKWGTLDVYGNPRVMNGNKMDIGAVEADWRPAYSRKIGKRIAVMEVDPEVALVEDGVKIPAGASLAATVGRAGRANGAYMLKATVEDGATCAVTRDGMAAAPLTAGANEVRYATSETGLTDLVFTADALGSTVLSSLKSEMGTMVILR